MRTILFAILIAFASVAIGYSVPPIFFRKAEIMKRYLNKEDFK